MTSNPNHRRPRRTAMAMAGAALALGAIGVSSGLAAAGEMTTADARSTVAPSEPVSADTEDLVGRAPQSHFFPGLQALAVYVQKCLDEPYPEACSGG